MYSAVLANQSIYEINAAKNTLIGSIEMGDYPHFDAKFDYEKIGDECDLPLVGVMPSWQMVSGPTNTERWHS